MDAHCPTKQLAFACLHGFVNGMLNNNRCGRFWLRFVPSVYLLVDRRQRFVLIDELLCLSVTRLGAE